MTEGAKTGKILSDLAKAAIALADLAERNTDDTDEWEASIKLVRNLSYKETDDLTEALKVAGEALEGIRWTAGSQGDARTLSSALLMVQQRAIEALNALERIRNNKH